MEVHQVADVFETKGSDTGRGARSCKNISHSAANSGAGSIPSMALLWWPTSNRVRRCASSASSSRAKGRACSSRRNASTRGKSLRSRLLISQSCPTRLYDVLRGEGAWLGRVAILHLERGMAHTKTVTQFLARAAQQGVVGAEARTD